MKKNYQVELEKTIKSLNGQRPKLLIHSCCAPCNSYVLKYLNEFFHIIIYFYNPNINISGEFEKRYNEQVRYVNEGGFEVEVIKGHFDPKEFLEAIKGFEKAGEGSERCHKCYELRIKMASLKAKEINVDYYTTSLTISPMKNAQKLNELGYKYEEINGIKWLPSDFKKKGGYLESVKLSTEFGLYRQDYCGCSFSKGESILRNKEKNKK